MAWEQVTAGVVAQLRAAAGADADDPRLTQLVGELSLKSERFRRLWARHDVRRREGAMTRLRHPQAGELHPAPREAGCHGIRRSAARAGRVPDRAASHRRTT
ncbi:MULTISPECIES: MmyB family transcriptional regulator [Streptomyces]|uniref:MmyB family transcriptional regulator n=1 Tax=Streptomyces TaxID=1883 RepID=UPI000A56CEDA